MLKAAVLTFIAALAIPSHALAWGAEGHQIVAHIAARELTPATRRAVEALLGGDAESAMVDASTWADEIRNQRRATGPWHYVDIPVGTRGYDPRRDCRREDCVVAQIERDQRILLDKALLPAVRAEALRFLIHFVGDIHQPLHASDNRDRGGNEVHIILGRKKSNLHSVWDVDIVRSLGRNAMTVANAIEADMSVAKHRSWQSGTAANWANESFQISNNEIYSMPGTNDISAPVILPRNYTERESGVVQEQLEKAGVRLAMVLNRALQ